MCMQEWYIVGVGKGVLFREVSSVQGCPSIGVPLYIHCSMQIRLFVMGVPCSFLLEPYCLLLTCVNYVCVCVCVSVLLLCRTKACPAFRHSREKEKL